jgi:hypothetical protein
MEAHHRAPSQPTNYQNHATKLITEDIETPINKMIRNEINSLSTT